MLDKNTGYLQGFTDLMDDITKVSCDTPSVELVGKPTEAPQAVPGGRLSDEFLKSRACVENAEFLHDLLSEVPVRCLSGVLSHCGSKFHHF